MLSTNTNGDEWAQQAFQQLLAYKHNTTLYHRLVLTFQSAILLNKKNKLAHLYLARTYQLKGLYLQASECVKAAVSIPITISPSQNTQNIILMLIDLEKSFESHRSYNAAKCCLLHATAIQSKQIEYNNDLLEAMRNVQLTAEIPKQKPLNEVSSEEILEKVSKKSPLKQEIEPSARYTHHVLHALLCAPGNPSHPDPVIEKTPSTSPVTVRIDSSLSTGCDSIRTTRMKVGEDEEIYPLSFFTKKKQAEGPKMAEGSEMADEDLVTYRSYTDDDDSVGRISPTA